MPQTMTYDARTLPGPESQVVGVGACVHETTWVVDVASHRVIRRVCDTCVLAQRGVLDPDVPRGPAPTAGAFPNTRN